MIQSLSLATEDRSQPAKPTDYSGRNMLGLRLVEADFRRSILRYTVLSECDLTRGDLSGAHLESTDLRHAVLESAVVEDSTMLGAKMQGVLGNRGSFSGSYLMRCELQGASFRESQWLEARLRGCRLARTVWTASDLRRMVIEECELSEVDFSSGLATSLLIAKSQVRGGAFHKLRAQRARVLNTLFQCMDGDRIDFTGAQIESCTFDACSIGHAQLKQAVLRHVSFRNSNLEGARFQGALLSGVDFRGTNLRGAEFLTGEQLLRAQTDAGTILPNGSRGPFLRYSGAERPVPVS